MSDIVEAGQNEDVSNRRNFLKWLWIALGIVAVGELIGVVIAFFKSTRTGIGPNNSAEIFLAGNVADFEPETVTAIQRGHFYLVRLKDGGFLAISRKCTHLGCTVPWVEDEKKFACPCHGSTFDITGNILSSPAPRALDLFPIKIENNRIQVDTGRTIRRGQFSPEQVVYL